jgi:hypothetical protein
MIGQTRSDLNGVVFDSPGCSEAEPSVDCPPKRSITNGAAFPTEACGRAAVVPIGITPFQGYSSLLAS